MSIKNSGYILIAGSANLDVLAKTNEDFNNHIRKKGSVELSSGGSAHNIAINISHLGGNSKFMGALNTGIVSKMLTTEMQEHSVSTHIYYNDDLPDPIFSGHFFNSELASSISSSPIRNATFTDEFIKEGLFNAIACILSTSLNNQTINDILIQANKQNLPVFISVNSKKSALNLKDFKGNISAVFLNHHEMKALQQSFNSPLSWLEIAKYFKTTFIITKGENGIYICKDKEDELTHIPVDKKNVEGNTLGAGDLIVSSTIYQHIFKESNLSEAIVKSFEHISDILNKDGVHLGGNSSLRLSIESAFLQADTDKLTGMLNRNGFYKFTKSKDIETQRFGLGLFDIDHFKSINDEFGHAIGDIALKKVAEVILSEIRSVECAVRWGGEEFLVILLNANKNAGLEALNRIRKKVSLLKIEELGRPLTISAGLAFSSKNSTTEEVIALADKALYEAKSTGRNKVIVS